LPRSRNPFRFYPFGALRKCIDKRQLFRQRGWSVRHQKSAMRKRPCKPCLTLFLRPSRLPQGHRVGFSPVRRGRGSTHSLSSLIAQSTGDSPTLACVSSFRSAAENPSGDRQAAFTPAQLATAGSTLQHFISPSGHRGVVIPRSDPVCQHNRRSSLMEAERSGAESARRRTLYFRGKRRGVTGRQSVDNCRLRLTSDRHDAVGGVVNR